MALSGLRPLERLVGRAPRNFSLRLHRQRSRQTDMPDQIHNDRLHTLRDGPTVPLEAQGIVERREVFSYKDKSSTTIGRRQSGMGSGLAIIHLTLSPAQPVLLPGL